MDMDQYILRALEGELLWYESVPVSQSAFVPYTSRPISEAEPEKPPLGSKFSMNMNKRMVQFLRKSWQPATTDRIEIGENGMDRCFRHMINERMRREKQRQSYLALHSMLPNGSKGDKNWIVQTTAMNIQQLQRFKEELRKRNMELEGILGTINEKESAEKGAKIRLRVANPTSGADSMLEVLRFLQNLGLKTRNFRSHFSAEEFSAELEIETKIGASELEKALQETLHEAEWKLRFSLPASPREGSIWQR